MAIEIILPRLGWTMEEGIFGEWLKHDGETVAVGDLLYTIETDKATQEVEALDAGILHIAPNGPRTGDVIPVGTLLGYLLAPGEVAPDRTPTAPAQAQAAAPQTTSSPSTGAPARSPAAEPAISPRARRVAKELGVAWQTLTGSGRSGRIVERDVRAAAQAAVAATAPLPVTTPAVRATPVARRLAAEAGIDLAEIAAAAPGARLQREDVEAAIAARSAEPVAPTPAAQPPIGAQTVPAGRVRRLIAQRMSDSAHTVAAVTLTTEADATDLVALREQIKTAYAPRGVAVPTYTDLLLKLVAVALREHPTLNATWSGDELILHDAIHIGLAVDTDEGVLPPVVRDAGHLSVAAIAATTRDLIARARSRKLTPADLEGGTFTVTNLGVYGIDTFTPIIVLPQVAILGIGRIQAKPAVVDGHVVPRQLMALSLTFDHRALDGGPAARFLHTLRESIETPAPWLLA